MCVGWHSDGEKTINGILLVFLSHPQSIIFGFIFINKNKRILFDNIYDARPGFTDQVLEI